jgi:serine/threonine protein phosphatase 1
MARVLALGDIHGCAHALDAVLDAADLRASDTLVVLGDVIDYGRDSASVIDRLMELRSECELICIQGNHEEMLLAALDNERLKSQWINVGGMETLNSYRFCGDLDAIPPEHLEFLRGFVDYYETDTQVFTHAGYDPDLPFADQPPHALRWQVLERPWPQPHCSGKQVVIGHTEQRNGEILDLGHIVCLDTACRSYGWLTLWDADTGETWQASKWGVLHEPEHPEEIELLHRSRELLVVPKI